MKTVTEIKLSDALEAAGLSGGPREPLPQEKMNQTANRAELLVWDVQRLNTEIRAGRAQIAALIAALYGAKEWIETGMREGWITRPGGEAPGWDLGATLLALPEPEKTAAETVGE